MENETNSTVQENQKVTRAVGIVSIAVMVSRILGLARETAIGYYFPAKTSADPFLSCLPYTELSTRYVR